MESWVPFIPRYHSFHLKTQSIFGNRTSQASRGLSQISCRLLSKATSQVKEVAPSLALLAAGFLHHSDLQFLCLCFGLEGRGLTHLPS